MGFKIIEGVHFFALKPIITTGGAVMQTIKGFDEFFPQFGECYFSTAKRNDPKAWKKHSKMICNLFVPQGEVKIVFYDDRQGSPDYRELKEFVLSTENYGRLVVEPGIWFGFSSIGEGEESIILNLSSLPHAPEESIRLEPNDPKIPYKWKFDHNG